MPEEEHAVSIHCHCGAVRARATLEVPLAQNAVLSCNCSICTMKGFLHLIVPKTAFTLEEGTDALTTYTFGTHTAQHTFCRHCGICPFYYPRSHPDGVSVNVRCVDGADLLGLRIVAYDGQNWERARADLDASP